MIWGSLLVLAAVVWWATREVMGGLDAINTNLRLILTEQKRAAREEESITGAPPSRRPDSRL